MGDRAIVYQERVTEQSPEVYTKSPNGHNRIMMYVEALEETVINLIRNGEVTATQNDRKRGRILMEKVGWDPLEGRRIWEVFNESLFIDGSHGVQRLGRIKAHCCRAFREWLNAGPLCKEPVIGIKCILVDATVHVDPAHTGFSEIASMMFAGLSLCFLNAKPRLYEPFQHVDIRTPVGTEGGILPIISQHRGEIHELGSDGEHMLIKCDIPEAETEDIAYEIRNESSGQALFEYEFAGFRPVPPDIEENIIMGIRKRKGQDF